MFGDKDYTVEFEVFGNKMKTKIPAKSAEEAEQKLHQFVVSRIKVSRVSTSEDKSFQDIVKSFEDLLSTLT